MLTGTVTREGWGAPVVAVTDLDALARAATGWEVSVLARAGGDVRADRGDLPRPRILITGSAGLIGGQPLRLYESQIMAANDTTPVQALRAILRTVALLTPGLLAFLIFAAVVVMSLGFTQALTPTRAGVALVLVITAAGSALIYYPSLGHLNSAEHIPLTADLAVWLVLCGVSPAVGRRRSVAFLLEGVTVVAVVIAAVAGHLVWGRYGEGQQDMLNLAAEVRDEVRPGEQLVAADASGYYGGLYLLLPPYLDIALEVMAGPGPEAVLCTQTGVARQPYTATPDCATPLDADGATLVGTEETAYGEVDFYSVPVTSG